VIFIKTAENQSDMFTNIVSGDVYDDHIDNYTMDHNETSHNWLNNMGGCQKFACTHATSVDLHYVTNLICDISSLVECGTNLLVIE
jgi:hypothetical protein